jgi:hypothetical protein
MMLYACVTRAFSFRVYGHKQCRKVRGNSSFRQGLPDNCKDAGDTTPWMGEVDRVGNKRSRATQGAVAESSCQGWQALIPPCTLGNCSCIALPPASMQEWISAQICLEQICIDPKGARQESLAGKPGMNPCRDDGLT